MKPTLFGSNSYQFPLVTRGRKSLPFIFPWTPIQSVLRKRGFGAALFVAVGIVTPIHGWAATIGPALPLPPASPRSRPALTPNSSAGAARPLTPGASPLPGGSPLYGGQAPGMTLQAGAVQALQSSPAILQALEKLRASEARLDASLALHSPQYDLSTTATVNKASGLSPFPTLSTVLSIPLDTRGRNGNLARQARAELGSFRWDFRRAQSDVAYGLATSFYTLLKADQEVAIAQDAYAQALAQQDAAQKRFNAGDVPRTDILKAQVRASQARSDLLIAQNAAAQARASLNSGAGTPLETAVALQMGAVLQPDPGPLARLQALLGPNSPEVQSAQNSLAGTEAALSLARSEGQPTVGFQGASTYTRDPTTYPVVVGAGVTISLPLPDGGIRRAHQREAQANVNAARAGLQIARRQSILDLQTAFLSVQAARQRVIVVAEGVVLAGESLRAANLGYSNGIASVRDVLDAQIAYRQARLQQSEAIFDHNLAVARVYNVLGVALPGIRLAAPPPPQPFR